MEREHELQCMLSKYIRQESAALFVKEKNQVFLRFNKEIHEHIHIYVHKFQYGRCKICMHTRNKCKHIDFSTHCIRMKSMYTHPHRYAEQYTFQRGKCKISIHTKEKHVYGS